MQKAHTKNILKHFYFVVVLLVFNMVSGCEGCHSLTSWFPKGSETEVATPVPAVASSANGIVPTEAATSVPSVQPQQQRHQHTPRFGIVLLHGLLGSSNGIAEMTAYFRDKFGHEACILVPTSREAWDSVSLSIAAQKARVLADIQTELDNRGLPRDFPIVPIGYSQGGLIACKLVADGELNSIAFATVNAPLMGTQFGKILQGLGPLQQVFHLSGQQTKGYVDLSELANRLDADGIKDLVPSSAEIRANQAFLAGGSNNVPGLLVSGFIDDPAMRLGLPNILPSDWLQQAKEFFLGMDVNYSNSSKDQIHPFNMGYALVLTGNKHAKHDSLLSVSTQLGQMETDALATWLADASMQGSRTIDALFPNVKGQIYKDVAHSLYRVNELGVDFGIETALDSRRVLNGLGKFVQEQTRKLG